MLVGLSLYSTEPVDWIDRDVFQRLLNDYINRKRSLSGQSKAIISFSMAADIIKVISKKKRQCQIGTAHFRYWAKKRFILQQVDHHVYLCPKTIESDQIKIGKPICLAEEMLSVLIRAHDTGTSHRSFTATYRELRAIRSWIPREICLQFVQHCTRCHSDSAEYDQLLSLYME